MTSASLNESLRVNRLTYVVAMVVLLSDWGSMTSLETSQRTLKDYASQLEFDNAEKTKQASRLDKEIKEHKETMNKLRQALASAEAATIAKSEFLANMSHELRTPLHAILGFSGFGINKYESASAEKILKYFKRIDQSANTLLNLLNDLLDLAKLEAGKVDLKIQSQDLGAAIKNVVDELESMLAIKNLKILLPGFENPVKVYFDNEKIMQVIRNLLSNAIKFSPEEGTIEFTHNRMGEHIKVNIKDQGVGIPEGELETIFDKFIQSSKTNTGAGGTGLGLSICKEIMQAHKGRIWASNNPDGGAIFSFELPLVVRLEKPEKKEASLEFESEELLAV